MCAGFFVPQGNICTCGVVGGYAAVLAVNAYVYTSLSFITLNILKRLLNSRFSAAFTDVPFQTIGESLLRLLSPRRRPLSRRPPCPFQTTP